MQYDMGGQATYVSGYLYVSIAPTSYISINTLSFWTPVKVFVHISGRISKC